MQNEIQGFERPQVEAWLLKHISPLKPPITWKRLAGGHSNLTYLLSDADLRKLVIRRPPFGELHARAHDMRREWTMITALKPTSIPVPAPIAFCEDVSIAGACFYVMDFVEGVSLSSGQDKFKLVPQCLLEPLARNFIELLAALHNLEPALVGLSSIGKEGSYIPRQISAWRKSWESSATLAAFEDVRVKDLAHLMLDKMPTETSPRIVHGDFGLHNCLVDQHGRITAVLDWEISTIGDPVADLAYALLEFPIESAASLPGPASPKALHGFTDRAALAKHYAELTGIDISSLDFYFGFNLWRKAVIAQGVYARYKSKQKDAKGVNLNIIRAGIDSWLNSATQALEYWSK